MLQNGALKCVYEPMSTTYARVLDIPASEATTAITSATGVVNPPVFGSRVLDIKMKAEVLTYSRARGIFAGVDLSGSAVTQDKDETHILYGKFFPFTEILSGKVRPPADSEPFLTAVRKYSEQSRETGQTHTERTTETAAK